MWIIYLIFGVNFSSLLHQKSNNTQIIILTGCMKCCPAILLDMYRYMNTECMCRERVVIGGKLYVRYIFVYVCAYMYLIHHTIHFSLAIMVKDFCFNMAMPHIPIIGSSLVPRPFTHFSMLHVAHRKEGRSGSRNHVSTIALSLCTARYRTVHEQHKTN